MMNISMTEAIRLIHKAPTFIRNMSNNGRVIQQAINKNKCLEIIKDGEFNLLKIADMLGVNRLIIIRYLKALHKEGLVIFICSHLETPRIEKVL